VAGFPPAARFSMAEAIQVPASALTRNSKHGGGGPRRQTSS
jgi:hypothetical protein